MLINFSELYMTTADRILTHDCLTPGLVLLITKVPLNMDMSKEKKIWVKFFKLETLRKSKQSIRTNQ